MAKKVQLEVEVKGNDSVAQASEKTKKLRDDILKLKETLASGGLGEKEYEKATEKLQKYEDRLSKFTNKTTSLQSELRKLTNEIVSGKLSGKDLILATERAGALKDQIADAKQEVNNLSSDTRKLDAFLELGSGIAGGFAAAQGAMALFGDENEDVQKALLKVQSAVAVLNGLQAIHNTLNKSSALITEAQSIKLKVLTFVQTRYTAAVGTTTGAMKLLRIAGATLGIGLIVTAIGLLIANFDKIKKAVLNFVPALANLGDLFTKVKNAVMDFVGISSEAERAIDAQAKANEKSSKQIDRQIALLEAQGGKEREIFDLRYKQLRQDADLLEMKKKQKLASQEEIDQLDDLRNAILVLNQEETNRQNEIVKNEQKKNEEVAKKRKEAHDKRVEQEKKDAEELRKLIDEATKIRREKDFTDKAKEEAELGRITEAKIKLAKGNAEAIKIIEDASLIELQAIRDKYSKEEAEKKKESDKLLKDLIEQRRVDDLSVRDKELNDITEKYAKEAELAKGQAELLAEIEADKNKALADKKLQFAQEDAAIQKEIDLVRLDSIIATANQASQLLGQVAGKNKAVQTAALAIEKGAAIAGVIINASRELSANALAASLNPLNAATGGAAGAAQLAKSNALTKIRAGISIASISAAGLQGAKQISSAGGSGGGGSVQPPNIRGSQTSNEQPTPQPTKVFVTEVDIRSSLRKVDGIYSQSTII